MPMYFINIKKQAGTNDHEVHRSECPHFPTGNAKYVGVFESSISAIKEIKKLYPKADGCIHCCKESPTS